ncbi:telomeric repeat-binding factor 2-interacting protein 1 [Salminus brasiliensis]|uniref:telomeric repeat-binding factor 2-interacting protein 1 n=1 Tax=Salminus brasiliensis TaxID=930266 RepID=UPI003B834630
MAALKKESSNPSPVLFLNTKGEPMRFFIRPGPTKVQLQPLIVDGGGIVCRTQEPNVILLADPGEVSTVMEGAGQFYISTQYILDCVAQNQQLDIKSYRFSNLPPVQTRAASRKQRGAGRMGYSSEDDTAILDFIAKRRHEAKGNRVWQQMEKKHVTAHSWQSMKDRFLKHLQFKSTDKKKKVPPFKESSSSEENPAQTSPQKKRQKTAQVASSSDSDVTQIRPDVQSGAEGIAADQPELQTSPEKSRSPQQLGSEQVQPHARSDEVEIEELGDEPNRESALQEEQEPCRDSEQPEVSAKRARMDEDDTGEGTSEGPSNQQTTPTETRQKRQTSITPGRKLGILERAAREFEDSQVVDGESQEVRPPSRASSVNSDTDEGQITAARERAVRELQENAGHCNTEQNAPEVQSNRCAPGSVDDGPGPSSAAAPVTSNAHMFIFDQESQEDQSQCSQKEALSQDSEEEKQHIVKLVTDSKKDLVEVMKALLKASGDVTLARSFLLEGYNAEVHGPIWTRRDDEILLSAGSSDLERLREKYGADRVLKRADFLKAH